MKKRCLGLVTLALVAAGLTACGESNTDGPAASADELAACTKAVGAEVDRLREVPDLLIPDGTTDGPAAKGKSIWMLNVVSNDFTKGISAGVSDAADALGMKYEELNGTGTTQSSNQMVTTAVGAGADVILMNGIDAEVVSGPLGKAKAAGIPVITQFGNTSTADVDPLLYADVTIDSDAVGNAFADYALDATGCKLALGNVAMPKAFKANYAIGQVTIKRVEEQCPSCQVDTVDLDLANLATATPTQIQSMLKKNPSINYIAVAFDAAVPFVAPAASAINKDVRIVSENGLAPNLKTIADGGTQAADVAFPPNDYIGWLTVHSALTALAGDTGQNYALPTRMVDETNIEDATLPTLFPTFDDFQGAFEKAWGLS